MKKNINTKWNISTILLTLSLVLSLLEDHAGLVLPGWAQAAVYAVMLCSIPAVVYYTVQMVKNR